MELVKIRASQINGCAFCLDMHAAEARKAGETEQRLYLLDAWRDSPLYSDRERAALAWTEALTRLADKGAPDDVYQALKSHFSDEEQVALTLLIVTINGWNRLQVGSGPCIRSRAKGRRDRGPGRHLLVEPRRCRAARLRRRRRSAPERAARDRRPPARSMRALVSAPPGAEKPPSLPPAASTRWQGMRSGIGFFAMADADVARGLARRADRGSQRAVSGRPAPADPPQRVVDLGEERVLVAQVERDSGEVGRLAGEIALRLARSLRRWQAAARRARRRGARRLRLFPPPRRRRPAGRSGSRRNRSRRWRTAPAAVSKTQ